MVWSKVVLEGRLLGWLFASSQTVTEESSIPDPSTACNSSAAQALGDVTWLQPAGGMHAGSGGLHDVDE